MARPKRSKRRVVQSEMIEDPLARSIIAAAMAVLRGLGPGLLESTYQRCLEYELRTAGFSLVVEAYIPSTTNASG